MYKQRDKSFTTNSGNLVSRLLSPKHHFTPYEFMSLRYACCQRISELSLKNQQATHDTIRPLGEGDINEVRRDKFKIKAYQRCINHLDNWFKGVINNE